MQFRPCRPLNPPDIVAGRQAIGTEIPRGRQEVFELYRQSARNSVRPDSRKILYHAFPKAAVVDTYGDAQGLRHARIMNV